MRAAQFSMPLLKHPRLQETALWAREEVQSRAWGRRVAGAGVWVWVWGRADLKLRVGGARDGVPRVPSLVGLRLLDISENVSAADWLKTVASLSLGHPCASLMYAALPPLPSLPLPLPSPPLPALCVSFIHLYVSYPLVSICKSPACA